VLIIIENVKFIRGLINSFEFNNMITAVSSTNDAIACVIKYFIEDSDANTFFLFENNGITDSRLISSPIHILIHE